jgi:hypothetical protein
MIKTILAIVGGVWIVGRLSRRSPNHPLNSIGFQLKLQLAAKNAAPLATDIDQGANLNYPYLGPGQETAQIQSGLVVGEGGGE